MSPIATILHLARGVATAAEFSLGLAAMLLFVNRRRQPIG